MLRQAVGVLNARIYIDGMYMGTGLTRASLGMALSECSSSTRRQGGASHRSRCPATLSPMGLPLFNER